MTKDARLKFLESLKIVNGRPAGGYIADAKKQFSKAEFQEFLSAFGWGTLGEDHQDYECVKAGTCGHANVFICDPAHCGGNGFKLGDVVRTLSPNERIEFLMSLRFANGRATNLQLDKIRRSLKPADIAELEKMGRP